jgi:hypothetical protein
VIVTVGPIGQVLYVQKMSGGAQSANLPKCENDKINPVEVTLQTCFHSFCRECLKTNLHYATNGLMILNQDEGGTVMKCINIDCPSYIT